MSNLRSLSRILFIDFQGLVKHIGLTIFVDHVFAAIVGQILLFETGSSSNVWRWVRVCV